MHEKNRLVIYIKAGISCGITCGSACIAFAWLTTICDAVFHGHTNLLYLLPLAGLFIVYLFDYYRADDDLCTDAIFRYVQGGETVSPWLAPLISLSTCLAYLFGGSVGRVGSALQLGGTLGIVISRRSPYRSLYAACGMAAGFAGILNAPIAGALFGVEVLILSGSDLLIIFPALISTSITWGIGQLARVPYVDFHTSLASGLTLPGTVSDTAAMASLHSAAPGFSVIWRVIVIALAATLAGRLFCYTRLVFNKGFELIKNRFIRVVIGSGLVIGLTCLMGTYVYNGIGFTYVDSVLDGHSAALAFVLKLLLTALTLGCGIRGGEIAPTVFIGATAAFALGCLIGLDPTLAAALGIVGTLASVTNCPVAIFAYGLEAICCNLQAAVFFAITALIAHFFSGTYGLYHSQHPENQPLKIRMP